MKASVHRGWANLRERAAERVDLASLATFRFFLGSVLAISAARFLAYGWIDRLLLRPNFRFKYFGFSWVEPLPADLMHGLFVSLVVLGALVAVGALYRVSAVLLALGFSYFQLIDASNYLNHYYLASLLAWLVAFLPLARGYSVDAWVRSRLGRANPAPTVSVLVLWLLRAQVGIVYFFAGLAKANADWLLYAQPLRIWLSARTDLPLLGPLLRVDGLALLFSWAGFLFDLTIVGFLLWRPTRAFAFVAVVVFHVFTRLLFPIGMFPAIMVLSVLVFFEPDWPRQLLRKIGKGGAASTPVETRGGLPKAGWIVLGSLYVAVQIVVPLRAFLYPGNVLWHEQGMRFSFRVMLRAKGGNTTFVVRTADRERPFLVAPRTYLTALQESEMSSQPDLIVQLAHHIRRDFEGRGYPGVQVFADSRVALNGRRSVQFLDPNVDLSRVRDGLAPVSYVLAAPGDPPSLTLPTY